jgi:phage terminase small subunit
MVDLTDLQQRFVKAYVGEAQFNATEAARRAGYQGNDNVLAAAGSRNLKKDNVRKAIQERTERFVMDQDEAAYRLARMARSDIGDFFEVVEATTEDGDLRTFLVMDREAIVEKGGGLVREISFDSNGRPQLKMYDAKDALKNILKIHGAFGAKGTEKDPQHVVVDLTGGDEDE